MSTDQNAQAGAEVAERIERDGIRTVRMLLPDLHGVPRAKQVTSAWFTGILTTGHAYATPLLSVDLLQDYDESRHLLMDNGQMIPDLSTFAVLPWRPSTAHVVCDFVRHGAEGPTSRAALRRVEAAAGALGYAPVIGNESEFYVFRADDPGYSSEVGMREWFSDLALGKRAAFLDDLHTYLPALGVPVYEIFNEHGAGQMEANLLPGPALERADQVFVMKAAIKEIALLHGLKATFMTKPANFEEVATSGYHLHHSVLDRHGENVFRPGEGADELSETGMQYLAGQLAHAPALTAMAAQTITAYKRYRPGTYAPTSAGWLLEDRGSLARLILAGPNTRIENRLGASDANPYLLAASQIAAGLDGIKNRLKAPLSDPSGHTGSVTAPLPGNITEAARALADDAVLREALGSELVDDYCSMLCHVAQRFQSWVTDWEIREYREVL
jgi:glutamine synthetase